VPEDGTDRPRAAESESPESAVRSRDSAPAEVLPPESTDTEARTEELQNSRAAPELQTGRPSESLLPATLLDQVKGLVLNSVSQNHSRRAYERAIEDFMAWYQERPGRPPLSKALVQDYRVALEHAKLAPSTINIRLAVIRKLSTEAADNGLLDPALAAGITKVKGVTRKGVRAGNWLTREQARELLLAPDISTPKGKRDRAILAVLLGCGIRRSELVALTVAKIEQRENRWVIVDLLGKGERRRTVPVPAWVKNVIDEWLAAAKITEGRIFRSISKGGKLQGERLAEMAVWWLVKGYAEGIGVKNLAPHDLRRTCARLCRKSGGDLEQIQMLLGHASIQTTEKYLGMRQNLVEAVNDKLGIVDSDGG
jgi:site-specific recombinase XerD